MDQGYVKLWRRSLPAGWLKNKDLWAFWCYCLIKATWKPINVLVGFQQVTLDPGQFVFGRRMASKELRMSERSVRTCLKNLEKLKNLTIKTTNKFSIITIVNWDIYQSQENGNDPQIDPQVTHKRPTGDHKQEVKNERIKELNNKKPFLSDSPEVRLSELLFSKIKEKNESHKPPNIQQWAKQVDLMIRIDKRTTEEIERVITWCQSDPFWYKNILSTSKLRTQFDQLLIKMKPIPKEKSWLDD